MLGDLVRRYASGVAKIELRTLYSTTRADAAVGEGDDILFKEDVAGSAFIIASALALILIVQILASKIRLVYWHLTKNPRIYYAHVHAAATSSADLPDLVRASADSRQRPSSLPVSSQSPMSLSTPNPHHATAILSHPSSAPVIASGPYGNAGSSGQSVEGRMWDGMETRSEAAAVAAGKKSRPAVSFGDSTIIESAVAASRSSSDEVQDLETGEVQAQQDSDIAEGGQDADIVDEAGVDTNGMKADDAQYGALQSELLRYKSLAVTSPTLAKNKEELEQARQVEDVWQAARRSSSGSVRTISFSASTASVLLRLFNDDPVTLLNITALVVSVVCLLFMQLRVAFMLKKYVLVLVSASLVPEDVMKRTIHDLKHKRISRAWGDSLDETSTGDDEVMEKDDDEEDDDVRVNANQSALQKRKSIGQFFREEAERGNMPGISLSEL
ncbi:hypothetical protein FGB62_216g027 [Gracilaria domingensis]|nr:hypothetical protein FGB62_216g027 [Gracilaria domingensis]